MGDDGQFDEPLLAMAIFKRIEYRLVDPVPQHMSQTPVHHAQYKILTLNTIYSSVRPADFPKMAEASDCPPDLKPKIKAPAWLGT